MNLWSRWVWGSVLLAAFQVGCSKDSPGKEAGGGGASGDGDGDPVGSSVALNGTSGYVSLGSREDLIGSEQSFSVSLWVKSNITENLSGRGIFCESGSGIFGQSFSIFWSEEEAEPTIAVYPPATGVIRGIVDDPLEWNHVVAVFDVDETPGTLSLYINTDLVDTIDLTEVVPLMDEELWVGKYVSDSLLLDGNVDEVAIWSTALDTPAVWEIYGMRDDKSLLEDQGSYSQSSDLVGYFRMGDEEGDGGSTASNLAGAGEATLQGEAEFSADSP